MYDLASRFGLYACLIFLVWAQGPIMIGNTRSTCDHSHRRERTMPRALVTAILPLAYSFPKVWT